MKYLLLVLLTLPVYAKSGKALYRKCIGCHGKKADGRSTIPKLRGQHSKYIQKQLHDIKRKYRKVPQMSQVVKRLSKEDIKELGDYLEKLGCK